MRLIVDNRDGIHNEDREYVDANISLAETILASLDGCKHTLLALERDDDWILNIGGGEEYFVVTMTSDIDENYTLVNQNGSENATVDLCAGGQYADFSTSIVVEFNAAKEALRLFFLGNVLELNWQY